MKLLAEKLFCLFFIIFLSSCIFVPRTVPNNKDKCELITREFKLELEDADISNEVFSECEDAGCVILTPIVAAIFLPAGSFIVSGSVVAIGNTIHFIEGQGRCDDSETKKAIKSLYASSKTVGGKILNTADEAKKYLLQLLNLGEEK